jgi:hypothetical protein
LLHCTWPTLYSSYRLTNSHDLRRMIMRAYNARTSGMTERQIGKAGEWSG